MIDKRSAGSYNHSHIKNRIRAVVRFYAFFILHRNARRALSFAQLRKGIIGMSYRLRPVNPKNRIPKP